MFFFKPKAYFGEVLAVQKLYDAMNGEARQMGAEILQLETELELAFREGTIDGTTLETKVSNLAELQQNIVLHVKVEHLMLERAREEMIFF